MDPGALPPEAHRLCAYISDCLFSWSLRVESALWGRGATIRRVAGAPAFLLMQELLKSSRAGLWVHASSWMGTLGWSAFRCPQIYNEDQRRTADTSAGVSPQWHRGSPGRHRPHLAASVLCWLWQGGTTAGERQPWVVDLLFNFFFFPEGWSHLINIVILIYSHKVWLYPIAMQYISCASH